MEAHEDCEFELEIFNKMLMPIPICNTKMGFKKPSKLGAGGGVKVNIP